MQVGLFLLFITQTHLLSYIYDIHVYFIGLQPFRKKFLCGIYLPSASMKFYFLFYLTLQDLDNCLYLRLIRWTFSLSQFKRKFGQKQSFQQ